ncbi:MAG TPA: pitrilysin family protein [Polyangia bacterium]
MRSSVFAGGALLMLLASTAQAATPSPLPAHAPKIPERAAFRAPVPTERATKDGLRVVLLPEHALPVVNLLLTVRAGSALDPPGKPGLAAATARFLQEGGAGKYDAPSFLAAVDDLGGELQVRTDESGVEIGVTVLATELDRTLALLSDLVARPRMNAADWPATQKRQEAEILRRQDEPRAVADGVFAHVLYGDHPYGHRPLGTATAVGQMTLADLHAFYAQHYGPRLTSVVLVGDIDPAAATAAVDRAFSAPGAKWNLHAEPAPPPAAVPPGPGRLVLVDRPGAPQSEVRVGEIGISWSSPELPAATLLEMVLGGSFTSRLNQNLREKHGYTYGARAEFKPLPAPGPFVARAAVRTDVTAESVHEFLRELDNIRAPLGLAEADKGRALIAQGIVEQLSDGMGAARLYGELEEAARPLDFWSGLPAALARLTLPSVTQAAMKLIAPDKLVIVVVGDQKKIEPKLRALGLAQKIELRDSDGNLMKTPR